MQRHRADRALCISHQADPRPLCAENLPLIADLAAALCIERGALHDKANTPALRAISCASLGEDPLHRGAPFKRFVADELCVTNLALHLFKLRKGCGMFGELRLLSAAAALSLLGERRIESNPINRYATLRRELHRQVDREAECVVQLEGNLAIKLRCVRRELISARPHGGRPLSERLQRRREECRAAIKRARKLRLFALE